MVKLLHKNQRLWRRYVGKSIVVIIPIWLEFHTRYWSNVHRIFNPRLASESYWPYSASDVKLDLTSCYFGGADIPQFLWDFESSVELCIAAFKGQREKM